MEASKRVVYALLMMGIALNILGSVKAKYTVQNLSSNEALVLPIATDVNINKALRLPMSTDVNIKVKVGGMVEIPSNHGNVILKNLGNGKSTVLKLVDGTVLVCVNGGIKGTISVYPGQIVNGVPSILVSSSPMITSL